MGLPAACRIARSTDSGVSGNYVQADGTSISPHLYDQITLKNVYQGIDLRLYSADQGVLEFYWNVAKAQDYNKIRVQFTGQDGLTFNPDGSATGTSPSNLTTTVTVGGGVTFGATTTGWRSSQIRQAPTFSCCPPWASITTWSTSAWTRSLKPT